MENKDIEKLSPGEGVPPQGLPFAHLTTFKNESTVNQDFIDKWVLPFYLNIGKNDQEWITLLRSKKSKITSEIIKKTLGDTNWRSRQTGAFFAAITDHKEFVDIIGIHLLKSELTYAGSVYCYVLASFNTPQSVEYLNLYLDYYLSRPDLWLDQKAAMEAILYLDKVNSTNHFERHNKKWLEFLKNKADVDKEINTDKIEAELAVIRSIRQL